MGFNRMDVAKWATKTLNTLTEGVAWYDLDERFEIMIAPSYEDDELYLDMSLRCKNGYYFEDDNPMPYSDDDGGCYDWVGMGNVGDEFKLNTVKHDTDWLIDAYENYNKTDFKDISTDIKDKWEELGLWSSYEEDGEEYEVA